MTRGHHHSLPTGRQILRVIVMRAIKGRRMQSSKRRGAALIGEVCASVWPRGLGAPMPTPLRWIGLVSNEGKHASGNACSFWPPSVLSGAMGSFVPGDFFRRGSFLFARTCFPVVLHRSLEPDQVGQALSQLPNRAKGNVNGTVGLQGKRDSQHAFPDAVEILEQVFAAIKPGCRQFRRREHNITQHNII